MDNDFVWWRDGLIYQIYPRSFMDSDHDGIGDLAGIIKRMDYLADLGVDAIWLSPVYPSPDRDFGYDVSDYVDIDPRFGSLADFDLLVSTAHQRQIRVIMDLVLNHTSVEHPWFQQSRSAKDNPYRDWYLWQPATDGGKARNNWHSICGGKGWEVDPLTGEYYFHMYLKEQPDLNWRNPAVRNALLDVFRFWLERGVDGFRLDVFNVYFKDAQFRNNPWKAGLRGFESQRHLYDADQPEMIPLLEEIRNLLDGYGSRYVVGETFLSTPEKARRYSKPGRLDAAFNFAVTSQPWRAARFASAIQEWDRINQPDGWPNFVLNNHDIPRSATRYHFDRGDRLARVAATMLLTLRGTPFIYYGEEIGMRDVPLTRSEIMDPVGKRYWPLYHGRDGCRGPMQWDDSPHAGFSTNAPWLKVNPDYLHRNVAQQQADPDSLLNYYRQVIQLRRKRPALTRGSFTLLDHSPASILAYLREFEGQRLLILLNFTRKPAAASLPAGMEFTSLNVLINSNPEDGLTLLPSGAIKLAPAQALILEVKRK